MATQDHIVRFHSVFWGIAFPMLFFFGVVSSAFAAPPVLTDLRIVGNNTNSTSDPFFVRTGNIINISFSSDVQLDANPIVTIGGTTTGVVVTNSNPPYDWDAHRLVTANDVSGTVSFSISYSAGGAAGVTATETTDLGSVIIDNTAPTGAISYSTVNAVKAGDVLTITAASSEDVRDTPVLGIALSGGNTLATTSMTKIDSTHYSFVYTVGAGEGTTTVALKSGLDVVGNLITGTPTSGATFLVDNTAPTIASAKIISGNQIAISYSETVFGTTTDYSNLLLSSGGTRSIIGTVSSTSNSVVLSFDGTAASVSATGTIVIASSVHDNAGNVLSATTTMLADGQAPLAPSTPAVTSDGTTISGSRETVGFSVTVPLGGSGAAEGDTMELLLGGVPFFTPITQQISSSDVVAGNITLTIPHGALGADGVKQISARAIDAAGNVGPAGAALSLTLDTLAPTITSSKIIGGNQIILSYSEPVFSTTTDYSNLVLSAGGTRLISGVTGSSTTQITISFGGTAASVAETGTLFVGSSVKDSAGNNFVATTTVIADGQGPSATLAYSKNSVHAGDVLTITASFDEPVADSPAPTLALSGVNTLAASAMTKTDSTHYTFSYTVGSGNGTTTAALGAGTDLAGNTLTTTPTSGATFLVDNTAPTGAVSYSATTAKAGDAVTISITTSEPILDSPALALSVSGANTLTATTTTKIDSTHYSFIYTAGAGDGTATLSLSSATDAAGNAITSVPIVGATFSIDNTPPTITITNASTTPAHTKTISASVSDGTLLQSITTGATCDNSLSFSVYTSTTFSAEADNGKKICYRATDAVGNTSFSVSSAVAGIDLTAPVISTISLTPNSGYRKIGDTITLTINADATGYTAGVITVNGVPITDLTDLGGGVYTATSTIVSGNTDRAAGTIPASVVLTDSAGNSNSAFTTVATNTLKIDAHAPTFISARTKNTTRIDVLFSEDLNGSTINSVIFDFTVAGHTITAAVEGPDDGLVQLTLATSTPLSTSETPAISYIGLVKDLAGNVAPTAGPITPSDGIAPVISETSAVATPTNDNTPNYVFTSGEAGTISYGGDCSSVTANATAGLNIITLNQLADGTHTNCTLVVTDASGNVSNQISVSSFVVDTVAPSITLSSSAPNPTNTSPIFVTATFSEAVTGFDASDITVGNGSVGNFSAASSTLYTFSVTPTGQGAVTVDIGSAKAFDSAGNGNTAATQLTRTYDSIAPMITIGSYATTSTNQNISVSVSANEGTLNAASHLFTANGSFDFIATDSAGNSATTTVIITNIDKIAPVFVTHATVTVEATSTLGAVGIYSVPVATDAVDGATVVSCAPLSGTQSSLGLTTITCTTSDSAGNSATTTFAVSVVDTTPPVISSHTGVTAEATSTLGASVSYTLPTATDAVDGTPTVICSPTSGSQFSLGVTTVNCTSTDSHGNSASSNFSVSVVDTTAPVITTPSAQTFEATSAISTPILTLATATDAVSTTTIALSYSPHSFGVGTTIVMWTATDGAGNFATATSSVMTIDTTPPTVTPPATQTFEATAALSSPALAPATATDSVSTTTVAISHTPTSFAVGTTPVTWSATDGAGNTGTATSSVTITDTTAPVIVSHATFSTPAASVDGATASYTLPSASDLVDGTVGVLCSPASGSLFTIGTTTISCSVSDAHSNTATSTFPVVVTRHFSLTSSVSVNAGAPDIVVSGSTTATSTVAIPSSVTNSRLDLSALAAHGATTTTATIGGAVAVNADTNIGTVSVAIPAGVTVSGSATWDGVLGLPRISSISPTSPTPSAARMAPSVSSVFSIGSDTEPISFSRAVRIVLPNQAGKLVGFTRSGAEFSVITNGCSADTQTSADTLLGSAGDAACKMDVVNDLVIWTNHFTSFVTYTETLLPAPSNGPIIFLPSSPVTPIISLSAPLIPSLAPIGGGSGGVGFAPPLAPRIQTARASPSSSVSKTSVTRISNGTFLLSSQNSLAGIGAATPRTATSTSSVPRRTSSRFGSLIRSTLSGLKSLFGK